MLLLALLGGILTIFSPCILPVIPLVFARTGRSFARETLPLLAGLALAFSAAALLATATARWLLVADAVGRYAALALLALVGLTLLSGRAAATLTRPASRGGAALLGRAGAGVATPLRNIVVGAAIGLLWAPCAGPILGVLIAAAATSGHTGAASLFLTFAAGAAMSLAVVILFGTRIRARLAAAGVAERVVRRTLGIATLATVAVLLLGWDRALFAKGGVIGTASAEEVLLRRLAPAFVRHDDAGMSLDDFAAAEAARRAPVALPTMDGPFPSLEGGTEWINSRPLAAESLRGKVVLVDFWTFACYNCLNALPHVKDLYAKYRDRGFVVIGVHTPELAHERIPANVRQRVSGLDIRYPVVIDNDYRIWRAFHNQYWPAAYFVDARGQLRYHHFGEGRYEEQDRVVAQLLAERDADALAPGKR